MVSMVSRLTSSFTQLHSACETSPRPHASDFRQPETPAKQDQLGPWGVTMVIFRCLLWGFNWFNYQQQGSTMI